MPINLPDIIFVSLEDWDDVWRQSPLRRRLDDAGHVRTQAFDATATADQHLDACRDYHA